MSDKKNKDLSSASFSIPSGILGTDQVTSNIVYQIDDEADASNARVPIRKGAGRFAKVYQGWQRSDGQNIRPVAIKILHNTASYDDEKLLRDEINLQKQMGHSSNAKIAHVVDILQLGPMVMCGCGRIYCPRCPDCGRHELIRSDEASKECPSLVCPDSECGFVLSAIDVEKRIKKLTGHMAKPCCKEGSHAEVGTIINFADRPAVVMDLHEMTLDKVAAHRSRYFEQRCKQSHSAASARRRYSRWLRSNPSEQLQKAMTLDRLMLMVQLAEAVACLHGDLEIIHKDLSPDNIMLNFDSHSDDRSSQFRWQSQQILSLKELLHDAISHPAFAVKVIDFGLADRQTLSRKWYEESDIKIGMDKAPYFSPEALQRSQHLNLKLDIDPVMKRITIPADIRDSHLSIREGDVVAFHWDRDHHHDLLLTSVEQGPDQQFCFAYFQGEPPPLAQQDGIQLIRPLGEPHDIYSTGALFYYIMTGKHGMVQDIASLVSIVQRSQCELTSGDLLKRYGDTYRSLRDDIPLPKSDVYWSNRIMELILRAMVRGRKQSFNTSRGDRGSEAAHKLLWETKRLYRDFQEQLLSEPRVRSLQKQVSAISAAVAVLMMVIILVLPSRLTPKTNTPDERHKLSIEIGQRGDDTGSAGVPSFPSRSEPTIPLERSPPPSKVRKEAPEQHSGPSGSGKVTSARTPPRT